MATCLVVCLLIVITQAQTLLLAAVTTSLFQKLFYPQRNLTRLTIQLPTLPPPRYVLCLMFTKTSRGEGVQLNNFNQSCEIVAKCSKFVMQNMPLIN